MFRTRNQNRLPFLLGRESLTSDNFMDHVAYGEGDWSSQEDAYAADCPATHPKRIPEVQFYFRILDYLVSD